MVYRPAQVYNGSGWDDIGDKRIGAESGDIPQASVTNLTSDLASKVDYALPVNAQTGTTYTFVAADAEKLTTASNASPVTLTIPPASSVAWPDNTVLRVVNYGAGAVTVAGGSGVTVTNTASTIAQYGAAVAIRTGSDAWTLVPFGGGDIPAAEVSSPAATGQYTDSGITYDYYTFTSSGTLTVDTAGFADLLVVGGGGGGGASTGDVGGGGGAGGYLAVDQTYLSAGSYTITIGGGGAGATSGNGVNGSISSFGALVAVGGGGGGGPSANGSAGGSGGGGGGSGSVSTTGGSGTANQGNAGGNNFVQQGVGPAGGGGGASAAGANGASNTGGNGGAGTASSITGSSVTRAGGGGGALVAGAGRTLGSGGAGGGGNAASGSTGGAGTVNTGGGGGGAYAATGGAGGSGVVIVRVKV